jgi:hypothetical protein
MRDAATVRLMAAEYTKWLATELGLSRWAEGLATGRVAGASAAG